MCTITGSGFTSTYGMPVVGYYNSQGDLVVQSTATVIASNGTYIEAPTPNLSGVTLGTYAGLVANKTSTGGLNYLVQCPCTWAILRHRRLLQNVVPQFRRSGKVGSQYRALYPSASFGFGGPCFGSWGEK